MLNEYLNAIQQTRERGDAREESYYGHLKDLILAFARENNLRQTDITVLPKQTEAGNPDFRVWDGKNHITGYIEAKDPSITHLNSIEESEQLKRYRNTFPNVILTNFYEFRLYRDGELIKHVSIGRPSLAKKLKTALPPENEKEFFDLLDTFFSFSLPRVHSAKTLASELAKRTRFLRDEVISIEMAEEEKKGQKAILGFYEAFKTYLIATLTKQTFADLYAQTITYGLFAARTRSNGEFNRELAFKFIPNTIGILRDVFRFISLEDPPKPLQIIVDDIAEILQVTDVNKILQDYYLEGKGRDPIIHFYETFLSAYDPSIREKRGVYYTPEPVVKYIVHAINSLLKSHFDIADGLAGNNVTLLDPAAGTLTFPAEAVKTAVDEFTRKYGSAGKTNFIKNRILENFYAFELMMAPYAIGHLKMSFLLEELGYRLNDNERFKLYLTNTLEMEELRQISIPGLSSLSEESHLAGKVKKEKPILVILGNPPYSGHSENQNDWTEKLLKEDLDGVKSYYKVNGKPLGEKNPKWLQDDYVKFIRFAQWKIHMAGAGIVGMITNHSYLDNPTFRGMRQSLMDTFNEMYILDLHGNSLKKETSPDGGKDENVFDIRQGVSITLFIKQKDKQGCRVFQRDLYGLREEKYDWLSNNVLNKDHYTEIEPVSPWYFFVPRHTENIRHYLQWKRIDEIFPVNSVGVVTGRDKFVIDTDKNSLINCINQLRNKNFPNEIISQAYDLKDKQNWKLSKAREGLQQIDNWQEAIVKILYRPFDVRYLFYHETVVERTRRDVMHHMLHDNIAITTVRQVKTGETWQHALVSDKLIESCYISNKTSEIGYLFPLYLYDTSENKSKRSSHLQTVLLFEPNEKYHTRKPNIDKKLYETLNTIYNKELTPEEILYYIYGIFYSNVYREKYAEFLKIDFPRVPFTKDHAIFCKISVLGNRLADLHLMKSKELDNPVAKYEGDGDNDKIEKAFYDEKKKRIYINESKYFDHVMPEVWAYCIGGYQVLQKYLKDRKGKSMNDPRHFCRMITALAKTQEIQEQLDEIYPEIENHLLPEELPQ